LTLLVAEMAEVLHDLCQPLTALQCRLELEQMQGSANAAWGECLRECGRLNVAVAAMRALVVEMQSNRNV